MSRSGRKRTCARLMPSCWSSHGTFSNPRETAIWRRFNSDCLPFFTSTNQFFPVVVNSCASFRLLS